MVPDEVVMVFRMPCPVGEGGDGRSTAVLDRGETVLGIIHVGTISITDQIPVGVIGIACPVDCGQLISVIVGIGGCGCCSPGRSYFLGETVSDGVIGVFIDGAIRSGFFDELVEFVVDIGGGSSIGYDTGDIFFGIVGVLAVDHLTIF
ncbi:hypothetical protein [Lihuaxuella thermophila]|uniref:Uncharacterized protein n=1 Tax=Lihuaxuella thermophila TaxID=1173111 RepID=A0A1H8JK91_9BACL|nr:hypothetical protein [Lihuaxuella thermophila]SEN81112.1 hypothetical protein SAMN05444955_1283 [Lihuaxuella thermophila]